MKCSGNCGKNLEEEEVVYQVRRGRFEEMAKEHRLTQEEEFIPDEDVGYYCSECLAKGV
ncbi:unnamed protein product [marine sediment metagenome]|uniref:Uncharacterized protein n=1 Tax=marine sediment metagenome TaxID=412755 RepID=X1RCS0_9ZZZZ